LSRQSRESKDGQTFLRDSIRQPIRAFKLHLQLFSELFNEVPIHQRLSQRYTSEIMPREAELSNNEKAFIKQALQENIRLDGRQFDAYRTLTITFGEEFGDVDLRLGKTRVAVRVSCEVTATYTDRKFDGIFLISCEFSPMAFPEFEVGRSVKAKFGQRNMRFY